MLHNLSDGEYSILVFYDTSEHRWLEGIHRGDSKFISSEKIQMMVDTIPTDLDSCPSIATGCVALLSGLFNYIFYCDIIIAYNDDYIIIYI